MFDRTHFPWTHRHEPLGPAEVADTGCFINPRKATRHEALHREHCRLDHAELELRICWVCGEHYPVIASVQRGLSFELQDTCPTHQSREARQRWLDRLPSFLEWSEYLYVSNSEWSFRRQCQRESSKAER